MVSGVCSGGGALGGRRSARSPRFPIVGGSQRKCQRRENALYLEPERACRVSGDDRFFVGANHADRGACVVGRDHGIARAVAAFFEGDSQELEAGADLGADLGRILTDAAGKDEEVKAPQGGGQAADGCAGAVAEHRDGLGWRTSAALHARRSRTSGLVSETPSRPDSWLTMRWNALGRYSGMFARDTRTGSGSISPHRVLITRPDDGVRPIVVSIGRPPCTAAMLAPEPRWARMMRPAAAAAPADPRDFLDEERVREPVKPVTADAGRLVLPGDRHDRRHARHVVMEAGVEAGDRRKIRQSVLKPLQQGDLPGQVVFIERDDPAQLGEQVGSHSLRAKIRAVRRARYETRHRRSFRRRRIDRSSR